MLLTLELIRDKQNQFGTFGKIYVKGNFICHSLEPPKKGAFINYLGKGCIDAGIYEIQWLHSAKFKCKMPFLIGVKRFSGIMIHAGNVAADTKGCILVGMNRQDDRVLNSRSAVGKLFPMLDYREHINIIITELYTT